MAASNERKKLLEVSGLTMDFGGLRAVNNFDLTLKQGDLAGLIGASNSPISGVGILASLGISLLLAMIFPTDEIGYKVAAGLFSRHVLTAGTLTNAKSIRIEPALTVSYDLIDEMLRRVEDTFASMTV